MKFGKSYNAEEETTTTGSSDYLRYFKKDTTTFRVLQEPEEWIDYWEHYNPGGYPFPCTRDKATCPGCTSKNEKMSKASKKVTIQVLEGEWVNAYKIPKTVADKLSNRANRNGTMTDRDYSIYKIQTKNADGSVKTEYDVEGQDKVPVNIEELRPKFKDIEAILTKMFNESWGDSDKAMQTEANAEQKQSEDGLKARLAAQQSKTQEEIPEALKTPEERGETETPTEGKVWTEEELRALPLATIKKVCLEEGVGNPPEDADTTDKVVDWLLDQ